jgi:hypothetical protein
LPFDRIQTRALDDAVLEIDADGAEIDELRDINRQFPVVFAVSILALFRVLNRYVGNLVPPFLRG